MRYRERNEVQEEINLSPLIDMVFILLIFFMVSATFVKDMDLDINRPKASSATPSDSKAIRVYIDHEGQTYVDGKAARVWTIQARVRDLLSVSSGSTVLVVTDGAVAANKLIEVVDQCRLAGARDVGVVTESEAGGS